MVVRISDDALQKKVEELTRQFHESRLEKLQGIKLHEVLARKNPYMFRAIAGDRPEDLAKLLLSAHISSSDETIWGNGFFEELAIFVAKQAHADDPKIHCYKSDAVGTDLTIDKEDGERIYVAVKSGKNVFNASSRKKQADEFASLRARLNKINVRCVVGYAYTKKKPNTATRQAHSAFEEYAGRDFWTFISGGLEEGDSSLYYRIMNCIGMADSSLSQFNASTLEIVADWTLELATKFSDDEGEFSWNKFLYFNSDASSPTYRNFDKIQFDSKATQEP